MDRGFIKEGLKQCIFRLGRKLLLILRQKGGVPLSGDEVYNSSDYDNYSRLGEMEKERGPAPNRDW